MNTIGGRFKYLRKMNNNQNQGDAAKKIGVSQGTLSEIENNKTKPSIDTVISASRYFNVSADWILTGKEAEDFSTGSYIAEDHDIIEQEEIPINKSSDEEYITNYIIAHARAGKTESMTHTNPGTYFISGAYLKGMLRENLNKLYEKFSKEKNADKKNVIEENVADLTNRIEKYLGDRFMIKDEPDQQPETESEIESYVSRVLGDISEDEVKLIFLYRQLTEKDKGKAEYFIERIIEDYSNTKKGMSSIFTNGEEATAKDVG